MKHDWKFIPVMTTCILFIDFMKLPPYPNQGWGGLKNNVIGVKSVVKMNFSAMRQHILAL